MGEFDKCNEYFLAHDEAIKLSTQRLKELEDAIKPLGRLENVIDTLGSEVNKLRIVIDNMGNKFITRELAEEYIKRRDYEYRMLTEQITSLVETNKWLTRGLVSGLFYVLYDIVKTMR